MKVVHIYNEFKFSGAEKMYVEAAPIFRQNGCELTAIATGKNLGEYAQRFTEAGFRIMHLPIPEPRNEPIKFLKYYFKFYCFLKNEKPDIVHIHKNGRFWWYALTARMAGIKSIRTIHNIFVNSKKIYWLKYWFERWSAKKFLGLIFHAIGDSVQKNELRYFNKSVKIYNWYSPGFEPAMASEKISVRERLNIEKDTCVIISIGGCSKIKNHHDIIKSLPRLDYKTKYLYIHLGTGTTENEERILAEKLGVSCNVRFEGNRKNVRDYLIASDVFVMTSEFEGLGIATIEAQACGIPVIVYNNPGVCDVVENEFNGFVITPDYHLLARKINFLFQNKYEAITMGKNGAKYSKENFSLEKNANKILELYLR